jgi:hypothetical protein
VAEQVANINSDIQNKGEVENYFDSFLEPQDKEPVKNVKVLLNKILKFFIFSL